MTASYERLFPAVFDRYIEPFLGGAAVYFHLQPPNAVLTDRNADLINAYSQLQTNWEHVARALRRHSHRHCEDYYYEERSRKHRAAHERAAQFIYLNRTCWNGLYRVNLRGEFNVPIGTKDSVLLDSDDFSAVSALLQNATLRACDFMSAIGDASKKDFLFVDPPYVTRHNFNGFVKYNDRLFSWRDQVRLAQCIRAAAMRGTKILVTNANHESVRRLYREMGTLVTLNRNSVLAADSDNRGETTEVAVTINYEPASI